MCINQNCVVVLMAVSLWITGRPTCLASESLAVQKAVSAEDFSIDAGLWRNEFLALDDSVDQTDGTEKSSEVRSGLRVPHLRSRSAGNLLTATDVLAGETFADLQADEASQLNDWDKAAANPDVKGKKGSLTSGPSLTSYIVGLVSAIVIIGGLVSGK